MLEQVSKERKCSDVTGFTHNTSAAQGKEGTSGSRQANPGRVGEKEEEIMPLPSGASLCPFVHGYGRQD